MSVALIRRLIEDRRVATVAADRVAARARADAPLNPVDAAKIDGHLADAELAEQRLARISVRREPLTYDEHGPHSYFRDLIARRVQNDTGARARLERHGDEIRVELARREARRSVEFDQRADAGGWQVERRDVGAVSGAGGEFMPPIWLLDRFAGLPRAGRALAALATLAPLPGDVSSVKIPRVTSGGPTAAIQTVPNGPISETDPVTTGLTSQVVTIAGLVDTALQLLEQSPSPGLDRIIFDDLAGGYDAKLGVQLLNGSGANGQLLGLLNVAGTVSVTYTDASPTVPELYPKLGDCAAQIATGRQIPAQAALVHGRRWHWLASALDTGNRPIIPPDLTGRRPLDDTGPITVLAGVPAWVDMSIPTTLGAGSNEDRIIFCRPSDLLLLEGEIRTRVDLNSASGTLGARLVLYRYAAYIPGRYPTGIGIIGGTGLAAPTFP